LLGNEECVEKKVEQVNVKNGGGEILANCGINCDFKELVIF
jgi:hypothetical protein